MTTLHLVRHGQTPWQEGNRYAGRSDVPLTEEGSAQAAMLAQWAATAGLVAIACSDLSRAIKTATPAAARTGLPLLIDRRLREVDFGDGEGLSIEEMRERFPSRVEEFLAHPASRPLPNAEPGTTAVVRALAGLADLVEAFPDGDVLVVSHSTITRIVLLWLMGLPVDEYRRLMPVLGNCARATVRLPAGWAPEPGDPAAQRQPAGALIGFNVPLA